MPTWVNDDREEVEDINDAGCSGQVTGSRVYNRNISGLLKDSSMKMKRLKGRKIFRIKTGRLPYSRERIFRKIIYSFFQEWDAGYFLNT